MNEQIIKSKIISIMKERLSFKFDERMDQIEHQNLFGKGFNLTPFELAYLLMEVEKEFNIQISESFLLDPGVKTINDFTTYIVAHQKGSERF
jgi:acyl carrier protein